MGDRAMSSGSGPSYFVKKRERTQNWVLEEKKTLLALIEKNITTLENRRLDTSATAQKNIAWDRIYRDFRRRFTAERDITKIKAQWSRMKSQARLEMHTFATKVKTVGSQEASKHAPSELSIIVWRILQNMRKNEPELDRSDESSQDAEVANEVEAFLEKLQAPSQQEEMNFPEIKTEPLDEFFEDEHVENNVHNMAYDRQRGSTPSDWHNNSVDAIAQKRQRLMCETNPYENSDLHAHERDKESPMVSMPTENMTHAEMSVDHAKWMFEAAQREHNLKMRMLGVELERAEFDKQKAQNELKTSEIKKKMVEEEAASKSSQTRMFSGEAGSGAGKGGGGGGSIRSAGGSFGKMEAAHEEQYFYNQQKEQLAKLRDGLHDEISFHEEQIKRHQEAIQRHKERINKMEK